MSAADYSAAALELHRSHRGKIEIRGKVPVRNRDDLSTAYTPGVAEPCRRIAADPEAVWEYTSKGNMVAVVTDGTAVLGLGNIGAAAALPVMEGKALLFKEFGGVDAVPICLDTKDADGIVAAVRAIAPAYGGINLEDISAPRCFEIERRLIEALDIPVFHDDQHGTAIVVSAALTVRCLVRSETACRLTLRRLRIVRGKLWRILRVGLPTGIQSVLFNISNVLIQSAVNSFDSAEIVAGNTASSNIEGFVYTGMQSFYQASLTFTSQNAAAHKTGRIIPILALSLACTLVIGGVLGAAAALAGESLLHIYTPSAAVVSYGLIRLRLICYTYFTCGLMDVVCGSIRGLGPAITPTLITLAGVCGLRIVWIYTAFAADRSLFTLYLSYPVSWIVSLVANLACFAFFYHRWTRRTAGFYRQ